MRSRWTMLVCAGALGGCVESAATPPRAAPAPDPVHEQLAEDARRRDAERAQAERQFAEEQAQRVAERERMLERERVDAEARRRERLEACAAGEPARRAVLDAAEARRAQVARYCHRATVTGSPLPDTYDVTQHLDGSLTIAPAGGGTLVLPVCDVGTPPDVARMALGLHDDADRARAEQRMCDQLAAAHETAPQQAR